MIIRNGLVFQEDGSFRKMDLFIENHRLVASEEEVTDRTEIDAEGLKVIPGLVDIHSHGAYGHDFSDADAEGLKAVLRYENSCGITSYCPTSMTLPLEELEKIFATAHEAGDFSDQARIVGINMEGPFLDPAKKGAHVEGYIRKPTGEFFDACQKAAKGLIKLVTLAPNVEGAEEFIRDYHDKVEISLGHTAADYTCAKEAMDNGALHITHLYNAMQPLSHRDPGMIGAAIDHKDCVAELICDGIHIHPSVVRATFQLFAGRVALVSDSMMATGMENGTYQLGGQEVTVKDCKATLANGTIAGSATNLFDCMRKAVSFGIPQSAAILAATATPAKSIGIYDQVGSIAVGKEADLLLVTDDLELKQVI